ncbi:hypothetical protein PYW07_010183 [Mythimna separata]|uniref:Major facilitator superfamily (MFS) profile domain-containing protein n=1 Tax=Mythimna separata TaxID=271217 RepID=A0AAD7YIK0_MYTSE|nr:hypothetical protein PYW07_010183 [Mythimna separata]
MGAKENNTSFKRQYLSAGCLYFGQFLVGYTMGWTAPVLPKFQSLEESPLDKVITEAEASWMVSITFLGIIGGPYISGYLGNTVGRKPGLYVSGCMYLLAYVILALAKSLAMIYTGRILVGVGMGVLFVTNIIYIAELASTKIRGTLLTMTGFATTLGTLTVYSAGPYISYTTINWIAAILCVVFIIALYFCVPESAVFHVMKGRKEVAMATLTSLGRQGDIDEVVAQADDKPKPKLAQLTEMYTVKSNRKATFIILSLNILGQFSGMMIVIAFVSVIFEMTGSNIEAHISTIIVGVTQVFSSIIAPLVVDRIGRKVLLLLSFAGCSLSLFSLGTYFYLYNNDYPIAENLKWLSLVSIMLLCVTYYSGLGIIPNTFVGEMFTDTCRGFGGTFTVTIAWIFSFGISTAFGYVLPVWGPSVVFWIFSGSCAFGFFFTVFFVPETKGKSLLAVQELLSK